VVNGPRGAANGAEPICGAKRHTVARESLDELQRGKYTTYLEYSTAHCDWSPLKPRDAQ
jgi:hypothetical protein